MPAKFVLLKRGGKFSFEMVAGNGVAIAKSVAYASKRTAMNGIKSVQTAMKAIDDATDSGVTPRKPAATRTVARKVSSKKPAAKKATAGAKRAPATTSVKRAAAKPMAKRAPAKKTAAKSTTVKRSTVQSRTAPAGARPRTVAKAAGSTQKRTASNKATAKRPMARAR